MTNKILNSVGYSGKVTLSIQEGNKILKTQEFNNSGTSHLFSFFAHCLMGNFDEASLYRPTKIRLLKVNIDESTGAETSAEDASGLIYLRSRPERIYNPKTQGETVKLSFMVPRTMISAVGFNRIGLYPHFASIEDIYDYSAYCDLSGNEDLGVESYNAWTLSSVLLVDWELTVSNKIIKTQDDMLSAGGSN